VNRVLLAASLLVLSRTIALQGQTAPSTHEDQALAAIRGYVLGYTKSLPDYTCIRVTDQKNSGPIFGDHRLAVWQAQSNSQSSFTPGSIVYEDQITVRGHQASYKVLKIKATHWTNGSTIRAVETNSGSPDALPVNAFGTATEKIFSPALETHFRWDRFDQLRGLRATVYSFEVPHAHGLRIYDGALQHDVVVGFKGLIFADVVSNAILRVEIHSSDFPDDPEAVRQAAFSGVDLTFDFGAVKFGGREFFLPLHLHLQYHIHLPDSGLHRTAVPSVLALTEDFRNYGSVSAQSALAFDGEAKPPETAIHSIIMFDPIVPPREK
jgi:hypothetical protein